MKVHTTNYFDTFIEVAEDSKAGCGMMPLAKGDRKTVAQLQHEWIAANPYQYTSDDILFQVFADRNELPTSAYEKARADFFSKGQPCFRASPLTKTYGFGIHCNSEGKMALYGVETQAYRQFVDDENLKKVKAMRTAKK